MSVQNKILEANYFIVDTLEKSEFSVKMEIRDESEKSQLINYIIQKYPSTAYISAINGKSFEAIFYIMFPDNQPQKHLLTEVDGEILSQHDNIIIDVEYHLNSMYCLDKIFRKKLENDLFFGGKKLVLINTKF